MGASAMEVAAADESFKKAGAVPFKWEIKPGVPKQEQHHHQKKRAANKPLNPPPSGVHFRPPPPRSDTTRQSVVRSTTPSDVWRFGAKIKTPRRHGSPQIVSYKTCLPSHAPSPSRLLVAAPRHKSIHTTIETNESPEPDYASDLETLARWSLSDRKTLSPFANTPSPISSPSQPFSFPPTPVTDAEWAAFGLF